MLILLNVVLALIIQSSMCLYTCVLLFQKTFLRESEASCILFYIEIESS